MITVYGRQGDACSYTTVTNGWVRGLNDIADAQHRVGGVCTPGDCAEPFSEDGDRPRLVTSSSNLQSVMEAPDEFAIITDPHLLPVAKVFDHLHYLLVLAPHSAYIPEGYLQMMRSADVLVVPPSAYCEGLLEQVAPELCRAVVPHGVDPEFAPVSEAQRLALRETDPEGSPELARLRGPGINFLHLAAGDLDRKGTYPLIEAFTKAIDWGLDATLTCVLAGQERVKIASTLLRDPKVRDRIRVLPRINAHPSKMRWFYSTFDVVIQPSRVEGFGMCPLEALCCGVPAVVTSGTGHQQWLDISDAGVVQVELGEPAPMASEPNVCPTVSHHAILAAIIAMANQLDAHTQAAVQAIHQRKSTFEWSSLIGQLMKNPHVGQETK